MLVINKPAGLVVHPSVGHEVSGAVVACALGRRRHVWQALRGTHKHVKERADHPAHAFADRDACECGASPLLPPGDERRNR